MYTQNSRNQTQLHSANDVTILDCLICILGKDCSYVTTAVRFTTIFLCSWQTKKKVKNLQTSLGKEIL